jgi:hypothetical protein
MNKNADILLHRLALQTKKTIHKKMVLSKQ